MLSSFAAHLTRPRPSVLQSATSLVQRLAHFLVVWSLLLFIHESGHAWITERQGRDVRAIEIGVGPTVWRGDMDGHAVVLRVLPIVGWTRVDGLGPRLTDSLMSQGAMFGAGVVTTGGFALLVAVMVVGWERGVRRRCIWGRMIVADAIVLTVFNFLPVPPLDGGRAVLAAVTSLRGAPLSPDVLFWTQLGGFALAVLPMTLWTRWTSRIDSVVMWWRAPRQA